MSICDLSLYMKKNMFIVYTLFILWICLLNALLSDTWALGTTWGHLGLDSVNSARTQPSCPFRCTQLDEDTEPEFFGTSLVRQENLMENVAHLETSTLGQLMLTQRSKSIFVPRDTTGKKMSY